MSRSPANRDQTTTTATLASLLHRSKVRLTRGTEALTRLVGRQIAIRTVVGVRDRVGSDARVRLEELHHLVEHRVDLALIAIHGRGALVVDARELGDPHGLAVLGKVVEDALDAVHVVLEDVHGDNVRLRLDGFEERSEPGLVLLHGHAGREEFGTSLLVGREVLLPTSGGISYGDDTGRTRAREIGLVEAHYEGCGAGLELLECLEARHVVVVVDAAKTPEHGYGEDVVAIGVVGVRGPIVVPSERFADPLERVAASDTCLALGRRETRNGDGASRRGGRRRRRRRRGRRT